MAVTVLLTVAYGALGVSAIFHDVVNWSAGTPIDQAALRAAALSWVLVVYAAGLIVNRHQLTPGLWLTAIPAAIATGVIVLGSTTVSQNIRTEATRSGCVLFIFLHLLPSLWLLLLARATRKDQSVKAIDAQSAEPHWRPLGENG